MSGACQVIRIRFDDVVIFGAILGVTLRRPYGLACAGLLLGWSGGVLADGPATALGPVTVTATRIAQPAFDIPASIDVIPGAAYSGDTLGVNLSEGLYGVPGLMARDRQNYAQDEQISVRGFGARSQFGVRSVRLYVDDIPATQPDGQGQVSHFNLGSADRVEVLRGPFSALYDNSSGGVIAVFTADGSDPPQISAAAEGGSYGTYHTNLDARGTAGLLDYNADYSHFHTDGFRDHSRAQRDSFNGKLNLRFGSAGRLTLLLNSFSSPEAQDPLGLTRAQFDANPGQSTSVSTLFNTRKSVEQTQDGAVYEYPINQEQSLRVLAYYGNRQVEQFLSIPVAAQASPLSSGGVVNLATDYGGSDLRWSYKTSLAQKPFTLVAGLTYDDLSQHRRGYNNFTGDGSQAGELGQQGSLRRDETDKVYNLDQYAQASWLFAERWSALVGVRHTAVRFNSADHYIIGSNGDDSGRQGYYATTPVGGILYKLSPVLHLYASYGEGFETPALNELAYRPDQAPGLNFGLQPARTNNGELGAKLRLGQHTQAQVAAFRAVTRNELVIDTNSNGRATYENAPRTRRQGVEASLSTELAPDWNVQLAYTYLDATVRQTYLSCGNLGTSCSAPSIPVSAGSRIPGVPQSDLYTALRWGGESGWHASLSGQYVADAAVNDLNSASTPSYALLGVDGGYVFDLPHWCIRSFLRIDNLLDTRYIGSIIVNDGNGRYYEPGPGRSVLAGLSFDWKY